MAVNTFYYYILNHLDFVYFIDNNGTYFKTILDLNKAILNCVFDKTLGMEVCISSNDRMTSLYFLYKNYFNNVLFI